MNKTIVIYHGGCRDGFCAAWVVRKYLDSIYSGGHEEILIQYHAAFHGQLIPDVKNKNIIIVDFCYPLEVMTKIVMECKSLIWLDHHRTAESFKDWLNNEYEQGNKLINWMFQNDKSGAGIAWDYFFLNEPRPWLVNYVEDRDLWAKKLYGSDQVNAYIATLKFDFNIWDVVDNRIPLSEATEYGIIAQNKTEQYVREVCKNVYFRSIDLPAPNGAYIDIIQGIPIVNICQVDCSEVMAELLKLYPSAPFSMYWFKRADGMYQYGMRSIGDFDVSTVAKLFGGGGHKNAAGFQLNYLLEELK